MNLLEKLKNQPGDRLLAGGMSALAVLLLCLWGRALAPAHGYALGQHRPPAAAAPVVPPVLHADFGQSSVSLLARQVADHVLAAGDHGGRPFLIVDKRAARLLVFDARGRLQADAPVLLGAAIGDDSVPGIGERKIADIKPFERTTPAGRFPSQAGRNAAGEHIIWVDYQDAISMHRVRANVPRERRLQRLATPTIADNRISYGCINVPVAFFDAWVAPIFSQGKAMVYVLPEVKTERQVFNWPGTATEAVLPVPGQRA